MTAVTLPGLPNSGQSAENYFVHFSAKVDVHFSIIEKVNMVGVYISRNDTCIGGYLLCILLKIK